MEAVGSKVSSPSLKPAQAIPGRQLNIPSSNNVVGVHRLFFLIFLSSYLSYNISSLQTDTVNVQMRKSETNFLK